MAHLVAAPSLESSGLASFRGGGRIECVVILWREEMPHIAPFIGSIFSHGNCLARDLILPVFIITGIFDPREHRGIRNPRPAACSSPYIY